MVSRQLFKVSASWTRVNSSVSKRVSEQHMMIYSSVTERLKQSKPEIIGDRTGGETPMVKNQLVF